MRRLATWLLLCLTDFGDCRVVDCLLICDLPSHPSHYHIKPDAVSVERTEVRMKI